MCTKLVLASNNPGKLREFAALFAPFSIEVVPQSAFDMPEAEEPHCTFIENALAKARHAARLSGLPALSDDSGLCVPTLGSEPGVHSAYYAGKEGDRDTRDSRNNAKLLAELARHSDRRAHYVCVLVLVRHAEDPQPIIDLFVKNVQTWTAIVDEIGGGVWNEAQWDRYESVLREQVFDKVRY